MYVYGDHAIGCNSVIRLHLIQSKTRMRRRLIAVIAACAGAAMIAGCGGDSGENSVANCGNGIVEPPEQCDDGEMNSDTGACLTICVKAECGDGFVWSGVEQCDTNNLANHTCNSIGF